MSYAQNFEDVMLWRALGAQSDGFYIDIGAWSPVIDSVTCAFYERGWRGINVEPNPPFFAEIEQARPRDVNLRVAVSDTPGRANMHFMNNPGLSTLDASIAQQHVNGGLSTDVQAVEVTTLTALWRDYVPDGQAVHFLKIDVEGTEAAVLRGNDWQRNRPWVLVVEATYPMSRVETYLEWEPIVLGAGYRFVYADGLNRYYIDPAHNELVHAFAYPPNVFDDFRRKSEIDREEKAASLEGKLADAQAQLASREGKLADAQAQLASREGKLADTQAQLASLEGKLNAASAQVEATEESLRGALASRASAMQDLNYLQDRKGWEGLFFRKNGRPIRAVRRALFHSNGKPRGLFKRWVLDADGRSRRPFRQWMSSAAYLALPRSIQPAVDTELAPRWAPVWRSPLASDLDEAGLDRLMERIRNELSAPKAGLRSEAR